MKAKAFSLLVFMIIWAAACFVADCVLKDFGTGFLMVWGYVIGLVGGLVSDAVEEKIANAALRGEGG